jgi:hypothetical protein
LQDYLLKDASKILGINYSTAKTILRVFRTEKRIEKKNAEEERDIKQMIIGFKDDEIVPMKIDECMSSSPKSMSTRGPSETGKTRVDDICTSIESLTNMVNKCFESIKVNQQMVNNLMIMTIKLNEQLRKGEGYNPIDVHEHGV